MSAPEPTSPHRYVVFDQAGDPVAIYLPAQAEIAAARGALPLTRSEFGRLGRRDPETGEIVPVPTPAPAPADDEAIATIGRNRVLRAIVDGIADATGTDRQAVRAAIRAAAVE